MKYFKFLILLLFITGCYKTDPDVLALLNEIKSQNDELKAQMTSLQSRTDSLSNSLKNMNLSIANLDKKVDSLKSQISSVLIQINTLNTQLNQANANIADIQVKITELQLKCAELVRQLEQLLNISTGTLVVSTEIFDITTSPLNIGGNVTVTGNDSVYEKGIIIGLDSLLSIDTSYANFLFPFTTITNLSSGGWYIPSNKKITVKSKPGQGTFNINILGATGSTRYYVRAYAKNRSSIFYGQTVAITSSNFRRDPRGSDFANVFWTNSFNLFDLVTDEIITPDQNGVYTFWYSSNEDPRVFSTTRTTATLPGFLFYKFKTRESCQRWCDLKAGRIVPTN